MAQPVSALVVDAEAAIRHFLKGSLMRRGYRVTEARTAREALIAATSTNPDVILLDPALPDQDGVEIIPRLKAGGAVVLVLSGRAGTEEKVRALDQGADDYVTKPFDTEEIFARIRSGLRHRLQMKPQAFSTRLGDVEIDLVSRQVRKRGVEVHLSPKEYAFLSVLLKHPGKVVTHSHLLKVIWGEEHESDVQYLRVAARGVRRKLDDPSRPSIIRNVPRVGYCLSNSAE